MTVRGLAVAVAVLRVDGAVPRVDSLSERVEATPQVYQWLAVGIGVQPFQLPVAWGGEPEGAKGQIAVGVQELAVERVAPALEFGQERPELLRQCGGISRLYGGHEVPVTWVGQRLAECPVVLFCKHVG